MLRGEISCEVECRGAGGEMAGELSIAHFVQIHSEVCAWGEAEGEQIATTEEFFWSRFIEPSRAIVS